MLMMMLMMINANDNDDKKGERVDLLGGWKEDQNFKDSRCNLRVLKLNQILRAEGSIRPLRF